MSEHDAALTIKSLSYRYKSNWAGPSKPALKDVTLTVERGEIFGFLGQSGSGKTTTIKCILNLLNITQGTIQIFSIPHTQHDARARVGYLPERPYFYDHLRVRELLEMYGRLSGIPSTKLTERIDTALEQVSLNDNMKAPLHSLSKGQTQRVAMAQAIVSRPELLILDEPFSGLDPLGRKQFKDLLFDFKKKGTSVFLSSHILEDIQNLCDHVSIMSEGTIKRTLSLRELSNSSSGSFELILQKKSSEKYEGKETALPGDSRVSLVYENEQIAQRELQKALAHDDVVEAYHVLHPTLEELFVETVKGSDA